jgi:hypothetical protein
LAGRDAEFVWCPRAVGNDERSTRRPATTCWWCASDVAGSEFGVEPPVPPRDTELVLVVRGTKKLRDRLQAVPAGDADASTGVLGDWFATALFWRPHVALLVNQRTFIPVFMPLAPTATLLDRAPQAIAAVLRRHGAEEAFVASELTAMNEARIAPTNDRSVVGVVNGFASHGGIRWQRGDTNLEELSAELATMPLRPLRDRAGSPDRELAVVLGIDHGNVVPFRPRHSTDGPASDTARVYQLKVTLTETKPPVWRRLLVDGAATLAELHEVIQAAFGWWNYHLYDFEFGRACYGIPDPDWDDGPPMRDARRTRLDKVAKVDTSFTYTYDFGDNWTHKITVEKIIPATPDLDLPACVGGRRAGPPEDCGGAWGYAELLHVLADPTHPEHAQRHEWVDGWGHGEFDPERFDPAEFADHLRTLRLAAFDD